ncbi:hypothetical protein Pam1_41 [Pseudanabaena phage Pam1]|nr:hypothetical protein Pam1_41 [Pseudanabaena phage Pam1]
MNGRFSQQVRVLQSTFRPYVSDEAFQSMDEADPFDQQEFCEWFDETHEELAND